MRLSLVTRGVRFNIYAVDLSSGEGVDCPATDYLGRLSPVALRSMAALLNHHAQMSSIRNDTKSRSLGDGIWEFKIGKDQGHRLYYFHDRPRQAHGPGTTILTHGSPKRKKSELKAEIDRAKRLRTGLAGG